MPAPSLRHGLALALGARSVLPDYPLAPEHLALMFCGTRDTLMPGCRLLAARALEAGWPLTYVEEPDLIHVHPLLPAVPEARRAWRRTLEILR